MSKLAWVQILAVNLVLGALYLGLAKLGLLLALPPGYATAIWPPAGLAFAACLIWGGRQVWPGILLGSVIANSTISGDFNLNALAMAIACGSTFQALIGELVLHRVDQRMELDHPASIGRFIAVTLFTCLIAASVGNLSLLSAGFVSLDQVPRSFITWWLGDSLGVLIFLPLTLIVVDPRPLWRNRRLQVGVPLLTAFMLTGLVYKVVFNEEISRLEDEFSLHTDPMIAEMKDFSASYAQALISVTEIIAKDDDPIPGQFLSIGETLKHNYPKLLAIEWLPLLKQKELVGFQQALSVKTGHKLAVTPFPGYNHASDGWLAPVALIAPLAGNEAALGRDLLSETLRSQALRKAWQSRQLVLSEKIKLIQDPSGPGGMMMVAPVALADGRVTGFVLGVLNLRDLLQPFQADKQLSWRLRDVATGAVLNETLSDIPKFSQHSYLDRRGVYRRQTVKLVDRELEIMLHKPHLGMTSQTMTLSSVVLLMALLISAGLEMFALVVSASAGRIAAEVEERTRQLREEIALREQSELLAQDSARHIQAVLDNVVDGVITIDSFGKVNSFNRAAEHIFGYADSEVIGKNVHMLMPEPYHSAHDGYLKNYRETGAEHIIGHVREVMGQRKDGNTFPMDLGVSKSIQQGKPLFIGVVRDISERKRIDQMKAEFVSTVSHELRTPVTAISGALGLIVGGALGAVSPAMQSMLEIAQRNSVRLAHLINDLLDMEKLSAGKLHFDFQVQPLMPLIEQCVESIQSYGEKFQVHFVISERADPVLVRVDAIRLQQVLGNLLSNAAKFSPAGENVSIKVRPSNNTVRIEVMDRGSGIPEEFQQRIFQKFSQADSSDTRQRSGTGLGLAISKELIEQMNGTIGFDTESGRTCFYFELPIWQVSGTS